MPNRYNVTSFRGVSTEFIWSQVIETPGGIAVIETQSEDGTAKEEGLAYAHKINELLQLPHSLQSLKGYLPTLSDSTLVSLLLVVYVEDDVLLAIKGSGVIMLKRNNAWIPLMKSEGILKGSTKESDTLVLWSKSCSSLNENFNDIVQNIGTVDQLSQTVTNISLENEEKGSGTILYHKVSESSPSVIPQPKKQSILPVKNIKEMLLSFKGLLGQKHVLIKIVSISIGIIFVLSVILGINRQRNNETYKQIEETSVQVERLLSEGIALLDVQPNESKDKLTEAKSMIDRLPELPKSKTSNKILELKQQVEDNLRVVSRVYPVELTEYFDANYLRDERSIDAMTLSDNTLFFLDSANGFLGGIALSTKNADIISGDSSLSGASSMSADQDSIYMLTQDTVKEFTPEDQTPKDLSLQTEELQSKDEVSSFGGNVYLLDKTAGQLWRYLQSESGLYGSPQAYFDEDIHPDLSAVTNIVIDGSVWFGTNEGKIYKYSQGRDDPFLARGVDPELGKELKIFTDDSLTYLYVLDAEQYRVVVLTKDGKYVSQYQWSEALPTDIVVSEIEKKVFLLLNQKIYNFALQ